MNSIRSALVLGLGTSGEAAARLLAAEGARVVVVDRQDGPALQACAGRLRSVGIAVELGAKGLPPFPAPGADFDVCVLSPGVPADAEWVGVARSRGMAVLPELGLGMDRCRWPVVAVTGSKGKSTLVKLCRDILRRAGLRAEMAGNCGPPVCEAVRTWSGLDWLVVEASSFQLETAANLRPRVAVLLNVQADHLDRHRDADAYARIKASLFSALGPEDTGIVVEDLRDWAASVSGGRCRWRSFGTGREADARFASHAVRLADGRSVPLAGTRFDGTALGQAAAAAALVADACGVPQDCVGAAIRDFVPLPHRLQEVATKGGVRFVNDSKATNLAALRVGVESCGGRVRLIAGGLLKEKDLSVVNDSLAMGVSAVYLIGRAAEGMLRAWADVVPCRSCGTLDEAVRSAWADATPGDTVLLSPGCASFDQFRNFEDRGEQFVRLALGLPDKTEVGT